MTLPLTPVPVREQIYKPLSVLLLSLASAALYAGYATLRFSGDKLSNQYYYVVPIVVPFVAFLFDRAERFNQRTRAQFVIDGLVVLTAMWRVFGDVPYVSGHALFLTYALLSTRSRVALVTAALVMPEVLYLKFFVWHDWVTPTSGMVLGSVAAFVSWRCEKVPYRKPPVNLSSTASRG
jgi:hypothetical protein